MRFADVNFGWQVTKVSCDVFVSKVFTTSVWDGNTMNGFSETM